MSNSRNEPREGDPTPQRWRDEPTLRLDEAGKRAAAKHIREGRSRGAEGEP